MNFSKLSDTDLETQIRLAVTEENKAKTRVLHLLAEIERRRLYSKEHPSLFEYCVRVLKYSSGAAQRRIDTMRAMKLIPEIEAKLISGELNLTSVSQAQTFFRHEAKQSKNYSVDEKKILLGKLENKSTRECIETLVAISPQTVPQEKRRVLSPEKTELKLTLDKALIEKLDRLKALMSHKSPHMTDAELLNVLADMALAKLDPMKKATRNLPPTSQKPKYEPALSNSLPAPEVNLNANPQVSRSGETKEPPLLLNLAPGSTKSTRYIPAWLKRAVWQRDRGRCTHRECGSERFLEFDHIHPVSTGGQNELSNLRLLCRSHNQRAAIDRFGLRHMKKFFDAGQNH
jgi:hypothetical protein